MDNHAQVERPHSSEAEEREAAFRRGRQRRLDEEDAAPFRQNLWETNPAFAALAENVRDYAIFLMDRDGIITFWGEGAHLMKWWTKDEAEGAHLRLFYPEGGSGDGTAEEHLRQAEVHGEYIGEGSRVRRDGSTFWAGVALTALRDPDGHLIGFAKMTRDLTARRAAEGAMNTANVAHAARDVALVRASKAEAAGLLAEEAAEFAREQTRGERQYITEMLEPELKEERARSSALREELNARDIERERSYPGK